MKEVVELLPLLNLLIVPVFMAYLRNEIRIERLEIHKKRVEAHLGFDRRDVA